jgi:8-oxo-dGTP diphosphatase
MAIKSIRPSVVLIKNNKILVLKSKYSSGEFYLLPGGSIEGMETVAETAIREAKEETNYDITIKKLLYIQEWIDLKRDKNVVYMVFLGEINGGDETYLNDPSKGNIEAIEWIDIDKLDKIKFYPKDIIPLLKKDSREGFGNPTVSLGPSITS